MWSYTIACVFILAAVTVNANYYVSNVSTNWSMANCRLAEPQLAYNNSSFYVNESLGLQLNDTDFWIGYRLAKIPFLFIGCGMLETLRTYTVTSIGYCFNACGGERFGIKLPLDSIFSNTFEAGYFLIKIALCCPWSKTTIECRCGSNIQMVSNCDDQQGNDVCKHNLSCAAIFIPINATGHETTEFPVGSNTSGDCMQYYFPYFVWRQCSLQNPIRVMCSNVSYTGQSPTTIIMGDQLSSNWIDGNNVCLKNTTHPSFVSSINNTLFTAVQEQFYWTGILRSTAIIQRSMAGNESTYPMEPFVFLDRSSSLLRFAGSVNKTALCVKEPDTATTTQVTNTYVYSTKPSTTVLETASSMADSPTPEHSPSEDSDKLKTATTTQVTNTSVYSTKPSTTVLETASSMDDSSSTEHSPSEDSDKFPAVGVAIGLSVGIMIVVGLIVVIVVLRRRGISPCTFKMNMENETDGKPSFGDQISDKETDDNVDHHNYFILEKTAQSANENTDHYNTAGEPTEDTDDNDHYNAIQETQEPYEHVIDVEGDYDYTTDTLNIGNSTREPDNVYNKLNINRPGDYDHIGNRKCNQANVSDDAYDTTSAPSAHRINGLSDYNRISTCVNAGQGNITIDLEQGDYDFMTGKQTKSKESGYDHVHI